MKRKSFIKVGWFRKKIDIPDLDERIEDYLDRSFLGKGAKFTLLWQKEEDDKIEQHEKAVIMFENHDIRRRIALITANYNYFHYDTFYYYNYFHYDTFYFGGKIAYSDSQKRKFEWPIEDFKNWPEDIKTFTLKFVKALEDAYYNWKEVNDEKMKKEKNFQDELKKQELEEVKSFFGEVLK